MALGKLSILLLTTLTLSLYHQNGEVSTVINRHRKNRWNTISVPPQSYDFPLIPAPYYLPIPDPSISPSPSPYSSSIPTPSISPTPTPPPYSSPIPDPSCSPIPSPYSSPNPAPSDGSIPSQSISPIPAPHSSPIPPPSITHTPSNDSKYVHNVISYGAVGDGKTEDTKAFNTAWKSACNQSIKSTLLAPKGYSFFVEPTVFSGPCQNPLIFQVDGDILAPENPDSWPKNYKDSWLEFNRVDGLTVQGGGLINGRGEQWWSHNHNKPVAMRFFGCSNLTIQGYEGSKLKVQNSPQFHFVIDKCKNVTVDSISIDTPATSPNTDGVHIASRDVWVQNSDISNGDDCISIADGSMNIHINNMTCLNGHGISIGSLGEKNSHACVSNITVTNSFIGNSTNGLRIKTWQGGSGSVSSVTYQHIQMDTVQYPIIVDQFYCPSHNCKNQTSNLLISDITYNNITGTYDTDKPPVYLACSNSVPCVDITIADLKLSPATKDDPSDPYCSNSYGNLTTPTVPPVSCLQKGLPKNSHSLLEKGDRCLS
ncbi:hypothetical protein LUZ60_015449 [Juncus effusus]|nr:hypothetical protein LUZ60_015449 [Juncus effusus]